MAQISGDQCFTNSRRSRDPSLAFDKYVPATALRSFTPRAWSPVMMARNIKIQMGKINLQDREPNVPAMKERLKPRALNLSLNFKAKVL